MVDLYEKQMTLSNEAYNLGRNNYASPILLYTYVCDGFTCAALGKHFFIDGQGLLYLIEKGNKYLYLWSMKGISVTEKEHSIIITLECVVFTYLVPQ